MSDEFENRKRIKCFRSILHLRLPRSQTSLSLRKWWARKGGREGERMRDSLLSPSRDPSRARPQFLMLPARLLHLFCDWNRSVWGGGRSCILSVKMSKSIPAKIPHSFFSHPAVSITPVHPVNWPRLSVAVSERQRLPRIWLLIMFAKKLSCKVQICGQHEQIFIYM